MVCDLVLTWERWIAGKLEQPLNDAEECRHVACTAHCRHASYVAGGAGFVQSMLWSLEDLLESLGLQKGVTALSNNQQKHRILIEYQQQQHQQRHCSASSSSSPQQHCCMQIP